jgi:glycosyltransferase involved in cell wall biosynthesis
MTKFSARARRGAGDSRAIMTGPRRLALVLPDFGGGGAERVALHLATQWVKAGHEVDLVLMNARGALLPLLPDQVRVVDLDATRIRDVPIRLARYLRERRPDGVQVSMWPLTIAGIVAHRLAGARGGLVVSEHSTLSRQYAARSWLTRLFLKLSLRVFYPVADARVAVSAAAADDLAATGEIDRASVAVVANPAPAPESRPDRDPAIESMWGGDGARILSVGRLGPEKNHLMLVRALVLLRRTRPARLMIVGEGPMRPTILATAAAEGVSDLVVLPGYASDPAPFYASADLFVLGSDFEGYGLVIVEAMHFGLPVVSTDCESGPREILADGEYGELVPCGDEAAFAAAMERALASPAQKDKLTGRARDLSGEESADRYLALMLDRETRK